MALRIILVLLAAFITTAIGVAPFLLGFALQFLVGTRKVHAAVAHLAGASLAVLFYYLPEPDRPPILITGGQPAWASLLVSLLLYAGFTHAGAFVLRSIRARRRIPPAKSG